MQHSVREEQGCTVVSLAGEVDLEHSPKAREVLLASIANTDKLFVDLSEVSYIDSSGVASLVETLQAAKAKSSEFALVSVNPAALSVLKLARLDRVFTIHANVAEGLGG
jgi:anti-sigma B factor antagonist